MGQYAGQGWLHPVTDFVKQTDPVLAEPRRLYSAGVGRTMQVGGDALWASVPFTAGFTLYYRTDIFDKYSLQPPQTWDDLLKTAKTIHEKESANGIPGLTMMAKRGVQLVCTHLNVFGSMGGYYYDKEKKPTMTSEAAVNRLNTCAPCFRIVIKAPWRRIMMRQLPPFGRAGRR